ncbi:MAG: DNA recombination protein RmuC [Alphaproteobacteria bacterium]|nr:DNA recombination protein RmuC [Alphaproteobacteria bacterium]MBQ7285612.1 DNA recombination protein RmuC [Alphaproteobacteria bacterium]
MEKFGDILLRGQAELAGRLSQLGEYTLQEQGKISQAINEQKLAVLKIMDEKLLAVTKSVGEGLQQNTAKTNETLTDLRERLAKIDVAQQKISSLSEQVVSLQEVLSNKQARGAFGEIQLNDLVSSILPPSAYEFQFILSNTKRADCLLKLPNPPGSIVIDAKFPLESYSALRSASNDREKVEAERFFRASVLKHIKDISEKYIVAGETAESALMFLPSEAVYAELHANFTDVVEASYRSKVWIVSPTTLMATLNTVRAVLKDAKMREQAGVIQKEVGTLIEDVARLDSRIDSLSKHFKLANEDVDGIRISSGKIGRRIQKIEDLELGEDAPRLAVAHVSNDD